MDLPLSPPARLAIKLKPAAERMVKKGHPWVFEASITKQSAPGKAGDLAIIFDQKKNKFLACGLYDPHSPIRIKLLQFHRSAKIDQTWLAQKIQAAKTIRLPLLDTNTNSYRLIYGENDGLPGLIADVYDRVLVVKLYSAIWQPYWEWLLPLLIEATECQAVVLRLSRALSQQDGHPWKDGTLVWGELKEENVPFLEHGLHFAANVIRGHKTGYFLDHRHNRHRIGQVAQGKTVLDVFAYAGGFSVHALAGGAVEVSSVDISAQALEVAQQNVALNAIKGKHHIIAADAFKVLEKFADEGRRFDIVVIDPPAFAKQASEVEKAILQYRRLANLGAALVESGGLLLLASCSSRVKAADFFEAAQSGIEQVVDRFDLEEKTFHDIDHPVGFPEGAYLKAGYYRIY